MSSERELQVGDKVVVVREVDNGRINVGMTGVVVQLDENSIIGVEFEEDINGHDCWKKCKDGHGWYVETSSIQSIGKDFIRSLHKTKWVELCERVSAENGRYTFIREPWLIDGKAVSILPFKKTDNGERIYLLRCEHADVPVTGTVKGGCDKEGESTTDCAIRELEEEAGYLADEFDMIYLGTARSSKLNTTVMYLFAVNVSPLGCQAPVGDGTLNEANAYCKWVDEETAINSQDPMIHVTMMRLKQKECE